MGIELEQLQETRRTASERLAQLESARKPAEVRIRVLAAPFSSEAPIAPDYSRDAGIVLAAALVLATLAVWLTDYLRREAQPPFAQNTQPIIQIAYPTLPHQYDIPHATHSPGGAAPLLGPARGTADPARELHESDVAALWANAPDQERLLIAAMFGGIAPSELAALRWMNVDVHGNVIKVPGMSARTLVLTDPLRSELRSRAEQGDVRAEAPLFADGVGNALDEALLNGQLACVAHDAGLRHPEEVTARALHFTYAAFLARQGIRMVDLIGTIGRVDGLLGAELMRLAPLNPVPVDRIERTYPSFRAVSA